MNRNTNDEWPPDAPVGTFDIEVGGVQDQTGITASIMFVCPNGRRCGVFLGPESISAKPNELNVWKWDGNLEKPTIQPSINCVGGCGWHGHITNGEFV